MMNIERFSQILNAYGSKPENWPDEERQAANQLLQSSEPCARLMEQFKPLDHQLDQYIPGLSVALRANILRTLPHPLIDRLLDWLAPNVASSLWRPILAGSLPLIFGIVIGALGNVFEPKLESTLSVTSDVWDDEIYLLALDYSNMESEAIR